MRIGISGYGRMGVLIRQHALQQGHEVPVVIDPVSSAPEVTHQSWQGVDRELVDVIIEFSLPQVAVENIASAAAADIPIVVGTTGWYSRMDEVKKLLDREGSGCIWSGNFSLGVNIFFRLTKTAAKLFNRFAQYDCMVHEYHHKHKADSPSGTAEMIGDILVGGLDRKTHVVTEELKRSIEPEELHVTSTRGGSIPGTHRVTFDSDVDTVVLEHTARNRSGFAQGAVLAAEWIIGRQGLYTIDDMMKEIIEG